MKTFDGYMRGMGIGGWLTNYKRVILLPKELRKRITVGDVEHFEKYITRADVRRIAGFGMDHIRLAFDQIVIEDDEHPFTYRESGFGYIDRCVDWCRAEHINLVLNLHKAVGAYCDCGDEGSLLDDPTLQERFIRLWVEFERRYHAEDMPFEVLNEVNSADSAKWNDLAGRVVAAIRALNPTRKIIIGSAQWNRVTKLRELRLFDDPNIVYTFHFYDPDEFTHQRGVLRPLFAYYNRDIAYPGPLAPLLEFRDLVKWDKGLYEGLCRFDRSFIEKNLQPVVDFIAAHPDKPLYFGEFGTIRHMDITSRENWMRDLIGFARQHRIAYCVWNYFSTPYDGNRFSLVDDDTRQIVSTGMLKAIRGEA